MKHVEFPFPAGAFGLGVDAPQEVRIPFGIEHDYNLAAADILCNQEFGKSRFAHPCRAQDQGMPHPVA